METSLSMKLQLVSLGAILMACGACSSTSVDSGLPGTGGALEGTGGVSVGTGGSVSTGGASSGGVAASGGGSGGISVSTGGSENVAAALAGLRVDDPCAGTPTISVGATCDHATLTEGGFYAAEEVTLGGVEGTIYDVTLRVRGVVEPTNVVGGTRPGTETFSYMGLEWRTEPFTIGGSVPPEDTDYATWSVRVSDPDATYVVNDYQRVGHYVFELDYEITIPVAAGATVTLSATDDNERLILNYEGYAPEGLVPPSNHGQFVELAVVSVAVR